MLLYKENSLMYRRKIVNYDELLDEVRENETVEVEGEELYIPLNFND